MNIDQLKATLDHMYEISRRMQPFQNLPRQFKELRGFIDLKKDLTTVEISLFVRMKFLDVVTDAHSNAKLRMDFEFPVDALVAEDPDDIVDYLSYVAEHFLTRDYVAKLPGVKSVDLKYGAKMGTVLATHAVNIPAELKPGGIVNG